MVLICIDWLLIEAVCIPHRILYGNRIGELPAGIFQGLSSLQLLLLNANRISCVRRDTFRDLTNLNLL